MSLFIMLIAQQGCAGPKETLPEAAMAVAPPEWLRVDRLPLELTGFYGYAGEIEIWENDQKQPTIQKDMSWFQWILLPDYLSNNFAAAQPSPDLIEKRVELRQVEYRFLFPRQDEIVTFTYVPPFDGQLTMAIEAQTTRVRAMITKIHDLPPEALD